MSAVRASIITNNIAAKFLYRKNAHNGKLYGREEEKEAKFVQDAEN